MTKPTILIVTASFSPASFYHSFLADLESLGFEAHVRDLPSADRRPPSPAATLADDAQYVHHIINRLCAEGKDVVVVAHSYGGCVATEAIKGLTEKQEGRGKVLSVVYLTALMPQLGESLADMFDAELGTSEYLKFEGEYIYHSPARASAEINFSDLPIEQGIKLVEQFRWQSLPSFQSKCTYAGYEEVDRVAFVLCEKDKTISPALQQKMIDLADDARKAKGKSKIEVWRLDSGHAPLVSKPKEVLDIVARFAGNVKD